MKPRIITAFVIAALASVSCSRKSPQAGPTAPEVLVTTVQPRDVPRVLERVATLDGFINANINVRPALTTQVRYEAIVDLEG
jgi:hypothetical protein